MKLEKLRRGLYKATLNDGSYVDFYKLPSDGLWRSSFFERLYRCDKDCDRVFRSRKSAVNAVEARIKSAGR